MPACAIANLPGGTRSFPSPGEPDPNQPEGRSRPITTTASSLLTASLQRSFGETGKDSRCADRCRGGKRSHAASGGAQCASRRTEDSSLQAEDWQRWNDYGIGLFLQGDLKGAQAAFQKVTEIDPKNPDGWVNIGRAAVQEGDMDRARTVLEKALAFSPESGARHIIFYARVLRSDGNYEGAANDLHKVLAQYPRDRVALNDLGRILFLATQISRTRESPAVSAGNRSGRPASALQPHALLQRPGR